MITLTEFLKRTNAEVVVGQIVVGERAQRRSLGTVADGTFMLNEEGHSVLRNLESGDSQPVKPRAPKRKPSDSKSAKSSTDFEDIESLDVDL